MRTTKDNSLYEGRDLEAMAVAKNYYSWLIKEFGQYIGKNVAEIGAGNGTFSEYILKNKDIENFYAIEPSDEMYPLLKSNLSKYKVANTLKGFFGYPEFMKLPKKLDTIFYTNVLEHIEYDEKELKHAYDSLEKGGYICIYVPALNWLMGSFDHQVGHYRRYYKMEMKAMIEKIGFDVLRINYSDMIGIIPWVLVFKLIKKKHMKPSEVGLYDKVVIPILKVTESVIKPPLGKNIFVVAQKN